MGRKRHTAEQILRKLREARLELTQRRTKGVESVTGATSARSSGG